MISATITLREVCITGVPFSGYILINTKNNQIVALHTDKHSMGLGKKLVDKVKLDRSFYSSGPIHKILRTQILYVRGL